MKVADPAILEETWRSYANIYQDIPHPPITGIKMVKEFLGQSDPNIARLDLEQIIDTKFVDRFSRESKP